MEQEMMQNELEKKEKKQRRDKFLSSCRSILIGAAVIAAGIAFCLWYQYMALNVW